MIVCEPVVAHPGFPCLGLHLYLLYVPVLLAESVAKAISLIPSAARVSSGIIFSFLTVFSFGAEYLKWSLCDWLQLYYSDDIW